MYFKNFININKFIDSHYRKTIEKIKIHNKENTYARGY